MKGARRPSRAHPLVHSRPLAGFLLRFTKADEGVGRGPGGPPYHSAAIFEGIPGCLVGQAPRL